MVLKYILPKNPEGLPGTFCGEAGKFCSMFAHAEGFTSASKLLKVSLNNFSIFCSFMAVRLLCILQHQHTLQVHARPAVLRLGSIFCY